MTERTCAVCGGPASHPHRTKIEGLGSTRTLWYCAEHWRERAGAVRVSECGTCKRLKKACMQHGGAW